MRLYALIGLAVVGAWLYYTINSVLNLYEATVQIARYTDLRGSVSDASSGLQQASDNLDRYSSLGQGSDLSQHYDGRAALKTALGAIHRNVLTEGIRGVLRRAEAAEELYSRASDSVISQREANQPGAAYAVRDNEAHPAMVKLREALAALETSVGRSQAIAEQQLKGNRDAATTALVILAALILIGLFWLLSDVNRRILSPCAAASRALEDLIRGDSPPQLSDASLDEIGLLGRNFNETARLYSEHRQALEARDIESSVNAVLAAAATINDLEGFGSKLLERVVEVTSASSVILYLPDGRGGFAPSLSRGGSAGEEAGPEQARRAAQEEKPIFVSANAQTPTVNLFDGRVLPRESVHVPLMHFGKVVGVLALGAVQHFTEQVRNTLTAIAPSLAVALANASANERLAEQSRRLAEQNELLEDQRSRLARTARELQRASALKDRFLAAVSHELRTPMTVILGFTAALLRGTQGKLNAQQEESLERVQRNARLLLGLINDVLDISRIEAGKAEITREVVSVATLLKQIETDHGEAARRKGLSLKVTVSPELETIISDSSKLTQILANLVGNALKFTEKGFVDVRAEPRGVERWALVVTDSGIGIPEDEQEMIFEEFRQGESTDHRGRGGTGLGLAIVRKLAILLGGTVSVQGSAGEGSSFTVTLPREIPVTQTAPAAVAAPPSPREAKSVLIVDDDESTRKLLRFELEPYGLEILEAADGGAALEIARARKPDAILLDVVMPRLDGWTALRMLKDSEETRSIPVVIHSVVDRRAFGFSLGAYDYLIKPFLPGRVPEVLSRAGVLGSAGRVLVVDDDPGIRELLQRDLAASGYRTLAVEGGAQALAALERERPSAVLLDLLMPEPDGFEVLYKIRENPNLRGLPVIVVTAKDLTAADYARINGSAQRILKKGADMTRLVRDILRTVGDSRETRT